MSVIYFIQEGVDGPIKIGCTKRHPLQRLKALQQRTEETLYFLKAIKGCREDERELHAQFAQDRINGEWFEPSEQLVSFINQQKGEDQNNILSFSKTIQVTLPDYDYHLLELEANHMKIKPATRAQAILRQQLEGKPTDKRESSWKEG